jgi:hypothetical protein
MNFNNISDDTKLRVRVPKALYESIQKELNKKALNEAAPFTNDEMPISFEIRLSIKIIEDAIFNLEKVKQTLLKIQNKQ